MDVLILLLACALFIANIIFLVAVVTDRGQ